MSISTMPRLVAFGPEHLPQALRLSKQVAWPHRVADWGLTLSVSEGVVAIEDGAVVGTALCSNFGDVAMLNMIIVAEDMRGRGLGRALMQAVIDRAGTREMRLTATSDGMPLYEKLGFVASGTIAQHQGMARPAAPEREVWTGSPAGLDELAAMDMAATGCARRPLLEAIAQSGEILRIEGGFALLREFGRGHVLGPVCAGDDAGARALLAGAASRCAGGFLRVDLRAGRGLGQYAASLGLDHVGGGTSMTRAARLPAPTSYALVSQALG